MKNDDYNEKFIKMRAIGLHAAQCLDVIEGEIVPGMSTQDIDDIVVKYAKENNLICAPLNYKGFPKSCCTSVNHTICHGIPKSNKILKEGDIVKVDITFKDKEGWHGDTCKTFAIGNVSVKANKLIKITEHALTLGIKESRAGNRIGDIGRVIQDYVEGEGFSVVKEYVGHGIGQGFHMLPHIYHYARPWKNDMDTKLEPGMIFTIEPMVNIGTAKTKVLRDKWSVVTRDRLYSAQFEHTIGITEGDPIIFTEKA